MALTNLLLARFSGGPYYVKMSRNRLSVRDVASGGYFDDEPLVAISQSTPPQVEAIGASARTVSSITVNPFSHPRVFVENFLVAEKVLAYAFKIVSGNKPFRVRPVVVAHVVENLDGGLTEIEYRVLHELFENVGARKTYFWEGRELTDDELRSGAYRDSGGTSTFSKIRRT